MHRVEAIALALLLLACPALGVSFSAFSSFTTDTPEPSSHVSTSAPLPDFVVDSFATCEDAGFSNITSQAECNLVVSDLGLAWSVIDAHYLPHGCVIWGQQAFFNTQSTSKPCSDLSKCVCAQPPMGPSDGPETFPPMGTETFPPMGPSDGPETFPPMGPLTNAPVTTLTNAPVNPLTNAPVNPLTNAPVNPLTNAPVNPLTNAPVNPLTNAPVNPVTTSAAAPVKPATTSAAAPVKPATTQAGTPAATFSQKQQDGIKAEAVKIINALPASLGVVVSDAGVVVSPAGVVTLSATIEGGCTAVADNKAAFEGDEFTVACVDVPAGRRLLAASTVDLTFTPKQGPTYAPKVTTPPSTTTKGSPASSTVPSALALFAVVIAALAF